MAKRGRPRKKPIEAEDTTIEEETINTTSNNSDEVVEVESDEENATHTTNYPEAKDEPKTDSNIVGEGTENDYNPFAESVVERDYSTPKVASGIVEEIEEPSFIPPSYEEIKSQNEVTEDPINPFDSPNEAYNELEDREKKIATEMLVDTVLDGYEQLHGLAQYFTAYDKEKLLEKQAQGKIDLNEVIPVNERGDSMKVGDFVEQYNQQSKEALSYDKEFGEKVKPSMMRVFQKRGYGMTDEQYLLYMFGKDISIKSMMVYSLRKSINSTISTLERVHKQKQESSYEQIYDDEVTPNNVDIQPNIQDIEPEVSSESFTNSLKVDMPNNPKDPMKQHPSEIQREIKKGK